MIQAIFFDFNGVISDDERIHLNAYREVLTSEGLDLTDDDYFACLGMDDVTFVRAAFARGKHALTDETLHELIKREHELHRKAIEDDLPVSSGVVSFIKEAARRYPLGVVSMAVRAEIDHVLRRAGLEDCFAVIVSAGEVTRHKPAPDSYQRALELLNEKCRAERELPLLAKECLVIEDAPPGIEAARAAGMHTIGVTNTVSESQLRAAGADIVTASLADWGVDAVHHLFDLEKL
ncbi:MAG TPA: HAD family phosphatase [Pyrinomonadaceae bacterium]|nr:HAD family phosphatase [Pyrinomonadaceae bacterium]